MRVGSPLSHGCIDAVCVQMSFSPSAEAMVPPPVAALHHQPLLERVMHG